MSYFKMKLIIYHCHLLGYLLLSCSITVSMQCLANDKSLNFPHACSPGTKIVIAAVGDLLFHMPLQRKGLQDGFESLWNSTLPYLQQADIAYGNLEGPIAEQVYPGGVIARHDKRKGVYTGYPLFNYPPSLANALKKSSFDIVSIANNHVLDRGSHGIDKTIQILETVQVNSIGARLRNSIDDRFKIIERKGIKIAWFACTEHANGIPDKHDQVLFCYNKSDQKWMLDKIESLKNQVDAIIVSPHWGEEYQTRPNRNQIRLARQYLEAGATAVIGAHPHVLQPVEKYQTEDGRSTLISYSLGNFVSNQGSPRNRSSIILLLGLTKRAEGTVINSVKYVPLYMENRSGFNQIRVTIPSKSSAIINDIISPEYAIFSKSTAFRSCEE